MGHKERLQFASERVVGANQVIKALEAGRAECVVLGKDADSFIYHRINGLCEAHHVPVEQVDTMRELGRLCGISVKAAAAAILVK